MGSEATFELLHQFPELTGAQAYEVLDDVKNKLTNGGGGMVFMPIFLWFKIGCPPAVPNVGVRSKANLAALFLGIDEWLVLNDEVIGQFVAAQSEGAEWSEATLEESHWRAMKASFTDAMNISYLDIREACNEIKRRVAT